MRLSWFPDYRLSCSVLPACVSASATGKPDQFWQVDLDEESCLAEENDMEEAAKDDSDDDGDVDDKIKRHKAKWQKRKKKYKAYADKGKVEKLEGVLAKQTAKWQKAKDASKPEAYLAYKQSKVEYTKNLLRTAQLVHNMKKSGLM